MQEILNQLIFTLNKIEVRGRENIDMLLGCIMTLENLLKIVEEAKANEDQDEQGE